MQKNISKINSQRGIFLRYLCSDFEVAYKVNDTNLNNRVLNLKKSIVMRNGSITNPGKNHFPAELIIQVAADRYFQLIDNELTSLCGIFTEYDMALIINSEFGSIWNFPPYHSIVGMVADDNGIEDKSDLEDNSEIKLLLDKLVRLTTIQNAALSDFCERFWRQSSKCSIRDYFNSIGFILID